MAFFLSLVVSWSNPRLREKRLFFYLFKALGIYTKDFTLPKASMTRSSNIEAVKIGNEHFSRFPSHFVLTVCQ
jgi:hypothetical protein